MSKFVTQTGIERLIAITKSELNKKVNEPSAEGTSGQVLMTDGNGGRSWATVSGGSSTDVATYLYGGYDSSNQIASGDDLNNYRNKGVYFSEDGSITSTLSNCPTTSSSGKLEVTYMSTNLFVLQKWTKRTGGEEWTRNYEDGTWTEWVKTIKEPELNAKAPWESVSVLTQTEYDAIETPVSTTLYLIKEV